MRFIGVISIFYLQIIRVFLFIVMVCPTKLGFKSADEANCFLTAAGGCKIGGFQLE